MKKHVFAVVGLLVLVAGLGLEWYLFSRGQQARNLDSSDSRKGPLSDVCAHPEPVIQLSKRTMSENDTQALGVRLNNSTNKTCTFNVTLRAPNFVLDANNTQSVEVPSRTVATLSWVIIPTQVGTFEIIAQSGRDTAVIGVTVLNVLGLTASQLEIISLITKFLGPMLSAPWWFEQFRRSRRKH